MRSLQGISSACEASAQAGAFLSGLRNKTFATILRARAFFEPFRYNGASESWIRIRQPKSHWSKEEHE